MELGGDCPMKGKSVHCTKFKTNQFLKLVPAKLMFALLKQLISVKKPFPMLALFAMKTTKTVFTCLANTMLLVLDAVKI